MLIKKLQIEMKSKIELAETMQNTNISYPSKRYYEGIEEVAKDALDILNDYIEKEEAEFAAIMESVPTSL